MDSKSLGKFHKVLWAVFLLSLPASSFPFFPAFMGKSVLVRPLALYPLFLLLIFVVLPRLLNGDIPRTIIPFIIFIILALVSTAYAFTQEINPPINISLTDRAVRSLATLAFGGLFYGTVSLVPQTKGDLRFTIFWLYFGFAITLMWASFQIVYILKFNQSYYDFLNGIQGWLSTRRLFPGRISGMTYEPSWFAEQLTFVLMPWLFASVVTDYSIFRWRFGSITIEAGLLAWSALALLFTFSRGGLGIFIILTIISFVIGIRRRYQRQNNLSPRIIKIVFQISLVLLVLLVIVFGVARSNNYFSRLWGYWSDEENEQSYLSYIAFSQRFLYWETGYRIFEDHPILGIGLGNFTFFFEGYLPDRPIVDPEIFTKLVPDVGRNQVVTVKNYLVRILAETGILGASAFVSYLVAIGGCVIYLLLYPDNDSKVWGIAGFLGLVAFLPMTLSVDSLAIPNTWVVFGMITSSAQVYSKTLKGQNSD